MNDYFVRNNVGHVRPTEGLPMKNIFFRASRVRTVFNLVALAAAGLVSSSTAEAATITQQAYLKASNTGSNDTFGASVAISGGTAVVGARYESSSATGVNSDENNDNAPRSGAAYVFEHSGATWTQQAYLKASNTRPGDEFGHSVAISGNTVVIGAPYEDKGGNGVNSSGSGVGIIDSGAAYIFVRNGANWTQQAYLKASNPGYQDYFGWSVAVSGDTAVVGAWSEDSSSGPADDNAPDSGAVYVFARNGTNWSQQAFLKAPVIRGGDVFGASVAASGDTLLISAYRDGSGATGVNGSWNNYAAPVSGAAYIFVRDGTSWKRQAYLKASNTEMNDLFGYTVAISGDTAVIGTFVEASSATGVNGNQSDNSAPESGAAYVFARNGTNWSQQAYLKASNTKARNYFGRSVGISGDVVVVGAVQESSSATGVNSDQTNYGLSAQGAVYLFARTGITWTQQAYVKASNTGTNDFFGAAVAISGNTVVATAPLEDSSATGVNGDQGNDSRGAAGAAYVFTGVCPACTQLTIARNGSNGYVLRFQDAPNTLCCLQRARHATGPWDAVATLTTSPNGTLEFHDAEPPSDQVFYRVVQP